MIFEIILDRNESKEMFKEWETANFKWPRGRIAIEATDIDEAAEKFVERHDQFITPDWAWKVRQGQQKEIQ